MPDLKDDMLFKDDLSIITFKKDVNQTFVKKDIEMFKVTNLNN
jgi:hypothetical protein